MIQEGELMSPAKPGDPAEDTLLKNTEDVYLNKISRQYLINAQRHLFVL